MDSFARCTPHRKTSTKYLSPKRKPSKVGWFYEHKIFNYTGRIDNRRVIVLRPLCFSLARTALPQQSIRSRLLRATSKINIPHSTISNQLSRNPYPDYSTTAFGLVSSLPAGGLSCSRHHAIGSFATNRSTVFHCTLFCRYFSR